MAHKARPSLRRLLVSATTALTVAALLPPSASATPTSATTATATAGTVTTGRATTGRVTTGDMTTSTADAPGPGPRWQDCAALTGAPVDPAVADCAVLPVPLDYARPDDGSVDLVMLRRRATDQEHRAGTLFVNPGGPGASGLHTAYRAERFLDPEVLARHDVIGFDPRGVNTSDALKCFVSQEEHDATLAGRTAVPVGADETAETIRSTAAYTAACARNAGPLLAHTTTLDAARDLDELRRATGDDRLSYVGFSYGTLLGATYANLYPHRVRAMILDGNVDPRLRSVNGVEYDRQRAAGMEIALTEFLRRCAAAGDGCAFGAGDNRRRFDHIRTRLRGGPLVLPDGTSMTLSRFTTLVSDSLATPSRLPGLARTLAGLESAKPPATAARPTTAPPKSAPRPSAHQAPVPVTTPYRADDSETAYNCLDKPYPSAPALWPALAARAERESPTFGRMTTFESLPCATWPARRWETDRYTGPWNRPTDRAVLVIGNRYDPTTRYRFAQRMADRLGRSRLVTVDMIGHTALGLSRCADDITTAYLLGRPDQRPSGDCRPDAEPFSARP